MKKMILISFLFMVLTGCSFNEKSQIITCTRNDIINDIDGDMNLLYEITYHGDYVEIIETKEKIISTNKETLELYKVGIEELYEPYKDVPYYKYNVELIDGNVLISTTKIDYTKIDIDKLIEVDSANGELISDGKIRINDVVDLYVALGATCK